MNFQVFYLVVFMCIFSWILAEMKLHVSIFLQHSLKKPTDDTIKSGTGMIAITGVLLLGMVVAGLFISTQSRAAGADKAEQTDPKQLEGRWVRPDGGYILDLQDVKRNGKLKAAYFNPKPINVAKATFESNKGKMSLFVELRDVNYPGSIYNLQYDPGTDSLKGTYFQAVERQTYNIEFVRIK